MFKYVYMHILGIYIVENFFLIYSLARTFFPNVVLQSLIRKWFIKDKSVYEGGNKKTTLLLILSPSSTYHILDLLHRLACVEWWRLSEGAWGYFLRRRIGVGWWRWL